MPRRSSFLSIVAPHSTCELLLPPGPSYFLISSILARYTIYHLAFISLELFPANSFLHIISLVSLRFRRKVMSRLFRAIYPEGVRRFTSAQRNFLTLSISLVKSIRSALIFHLYLITILQRFYLLFTYTFLSLIGINYDFCVNKESLIAKLS